MKSPNKIKNVHIHIWTRYDAWYSKPNEWNWCLYSGVERIHRWINDTLLPFRILFSIFVCCCNLFIKFSMFFVVVAIVAIWWIAGKDCIRIRDIWSSGNYSDAIEKQKKGKKTKLTEKHTIKVEQYKRVKILIQNSYDFNSKSHWMNRRRWQKKRF